MPDWLYRNVDVYTWGSKYRTILYSSCYILKEPKNTEKKCYCELNAFSRIVFQCTYRFRKYDFPRVVNRRSRFPHAQRERLDSWKARIAAQPTENPQLCHCTPSSNHMFVATSFCVFSIIVLFSLGLPFGKLLR